MTAPPIATDKPALEVRDLTVRFRQRHGEIAAVNGVSFGLAPGEVLGILGESGSGKSVTLRAIMRLLPPERTVIGGQVRIGGTDMLALAPGELDRARGKRVAMIFQEPMLALDPVFSVGEQIAETVVRHEGVGWADANRRALELFELVQIPSAKRRLAAYPHELSGGMRQRAMIALALSCRPQVLLADEPTTALDVTVQIQIVLLLRELQQALGMAVVFVTHDIGVAVEISDRLAVMYAGRFVENGTVEAVIDRPSHPYTLGLLNSTVHGSRRGLRLEPIPGSPPDLSALPGGCSFQPRCTRAIADCRVAVPDPVELGPDHTARCIRLG